MNRKKTIEIALGTLNPKFLSVINNSSEHVGHSGNPDNKDDTHFTVQINSAKLDGLSKIKQHRIINNLLKDEFANGLHALSIQIIP